MTLITKFHNLILDIGLTESQFHFYDIPIYKLTKASISFDLSDTSIYQFLKFDPDGDDDHELNPEYFAMVYFRAVKIYNSLKDSFDILRFDCYPNDGNPQKLTEIFCNISGLPLPDEHIKQILYGDDQEPFTQFQMYWNLKNHHFSPQNLISEITKADFGGFSDLASSVYFADTKNSLLLNVYDDRGAVLFAPNIEKLYPFYKEFNNWIAEYERTKIDDMFSGK